VDDLFTPEIDADDTTSDVGKTEANDDLKVEALVREIDGMDHAGTRRTAVPRLSGMNFQAVSVAQKLPAHGYADAAGTPSAGLGAALEYTDRSIGRLLAALNDKGLLNTTLIVVTSKHGQSPIDRRRLLRLDPKRSPNIAGVINALEPGLVAHETRDDISLIWLKDSGRAAAAVRALRNQRDGLAIDEIYSGGFLTLEFGDPLRDPRVPDIIVQPRAGVIYTGSSGKIAEHGGFADDDVHVALLISAQGMAKAEVSFPVRTAQVAPTILKALGLDPTALKAVQLERTTVLPGLEGAVPASP
jgi:arylsulfatase A-like enzyme